MSHHYNPDAVGGISGCLILVSMKILTSPMIHILEAAVTGAVGATAGFIVTHYLRKIFQKK